MSEKENKEEIFNSADELLVDAGVAAVERKIHCAFGNVTCAKAFVEDKQAFVSSVQGMLYDAKKTLDILSANKDVLSPRMVRRIEARQKTVGDLLDDLDAMLA